MCEFHNWLLIQAQGLDSSPDPAWFQKALSNMPCKTQNPWQKTKPKQKSHQEKKK